MGCTTVILAGRYQVLLLIAHLLVSERNAVPLEHWLAQRIHTPAGELQRRGGPTDPGTQATVARSNGVTNPCVGLELAGGTYCATVRCQSGVTSVVGALQLRCMYECSFAVISSLVHTYPRTAPRTCLLRVSQRGRRTQSCPACEHTDAVRRRCL